MSDLDDYFKYKSITNLYIKYDDDKLEYLYNQDRNNDIIEAHFKLNEDKIHYWTVKLNKKSTPFVIASGYITKDNIKLLSNREKSTIAVINFMSADNKDYMYGVFFYNINPKIQLQFTNEYELRVETNPEYKVVMVYNTDSDELEYIHYIDDNLYIVEDILQNNESILLNKQNIKYEFKFKNLSKSNYIQYHQPYRVTNYTINKQYVMEYNDYGIMTSMKDISEPDVELCQYEANMLFSRSSMEYISIHPDIYNSFDRSELKTDFIESKEYVGERFITIPSSKTYKRFTFLKEE